MYYQLSAPKCQCVYRLEKLTNNLYIHAMFTDKYVEILRNEGVGVIPTDTLYGVVGVWGSDSALKRIKEVRRVDKKPNGWITLISDINDLKKMAIDLSQKQFDMLSKIWPGAFSVGFKDEPGAYRLPAQNELRDFLKKTGPLIAPSANITGYAPARNINEANDYFAESVDFYVDGGELNGNPSTVIVLNDNAVEIIREGAGDISLLREYITDIIE